MKNWMAAAVTTAFIAGCGTDQYVTVQGTKTISKGQELNDLRRALNERAINQAEFQSLRSGYGPVRIKKRGCIDILGGMDVTHLDVSRNSGGSMKSFLLALFLLPTLSHAQTLVAKAADGAEWLIYVETINVGDPLQNRDRLVSALVEKRDAQRSIGESGSPIHDRLLHAWRRDYRWGENGRADEWTWGGPLVLDILATRMCQYAWDRVEPDAGIEFPLKHAVSHRGNTASASGPTRGNVGL